MLLNKEEIKSILDMYNISSFDAFNMIDTSHGDNDIRHNYIIDKKYVLRINSAKVMKDKRIKELITLIQQYNTFGFKAPYFISITDGTYLFEYKELYCYLSEYLDLEIADNVKEICRKELIKERVIFVSKFAQQFKNVDLIDTMSMYSLFALCPYDQFIGIDEKQENFNNLYNDLKAAKEYDLAEKLYTLNENKRNKLLSYYKELP